MRKSTTALTPAQVYRFALDFCQPTSSFRRQGQGHRHGPPDRPLRRRRPDLLALRDLPPAPRRPLRGDLRAPPSTPTLLPRAAQRQVNAALAGHLPRALRRDRKRPLRVAIDLTLIPYHGEPSADLDEIYRGQAKDGTSPFHAYATAYVVRKGQRYTVALTGVTSCEPLKDVVQELLRQVPQGRAPARLAAPGSRLLQRGGGPLPPAGAAAVPDAGGLPRPLAQASRGPQRQQVFQLEEERLVRPTP